MGRAKVTVDSAAMQRDLSAVVEHMYAAARQVIAESSDQIATDARAGVGVDSGELREGIEVAITGSGLTATVGVLDPGLDYAKFVEFGTAEMPAEPFLDPAVEAERTRLARRMAEAINARLR